VLEIQTCPISGVEHDQNLSLEPSLGTGHVQCLGLTRVKAEEPDMFGIRTGYVQKILL
jgi:hypothetical protein